MRRGKEDGIEKQIFFSSALVQQKGTTISEAMIDEYIWVGKFN